MNVLLNLAVIVQILSAIALVVLILLQHGKGADMGAAFGAGSSGSLFGASGSANFLSHATAVLVTIFLATTLALAHFGYSVPSSSTSNGSVLDRLPVTAPAVPSAPASDSAGAIPAPAAAPASPASPPASEAPPSGAGAEQIPSK